MNTLKLDIKELEIDSQLNEIASSTGTRYFDYNEVFKTAVILPKHSDYRIITFSEITSPFMLIIVSDSPITAKVNDFEIAETKMVLLNMAIETLEIANDEEVEANVNIYIWGKQ